MIGTRPGKGQRKTGRSRPRGRSAMWNADLSHIREEDARCIIIIIAGQEMRRCCPKSGWMLNKKSF